MSPAPIRLEFSSIPVRHPHCGDLLLHAFGMAATHRLSIDPELLDESMTEREVTIDHTPNRSKKAPQQRVIISWSGSVDRDLSVRAHLAINANDLTEMAAILVASLTVSHFENGRIRSVLQIGSGGDYEVEVDWQRKPVQMEVSGLRADDTPKGNATAACVTKKRAQVGTGFVSVTAFRHFATGLPHSVLCYADGDE